MNILQWLRNQRYDYTWNVKIGTKTPDIIAFKDREIVVFEIKKYAREVPEAIDECLSYLKNVNKVYIVLPLKEIQKIQTRLFKKHGIGLIQANKDVKVLIEPSLFISYNKDFIEKLKNKNLSPKPNNRKNIENEIENILRENSNGLSITEISRLLQIHRHTIVKYIQRLVKVDTIYQRNVGPAKLFYLKEVGKYEK